MSGVKVSIGPRSVFDTSYKAYAEIPWNAVGSAVVTELVNRLADKFMEEHGDAMLALVDLNVIRAAVVEVVAAKLRGDGAVTRDQVRDIAVKVREGVCPACGEHWRANTKNSAGWSFAPEFSATLRERGVDPGNGHKVGCAEAGKV